VPQQDAGPSGEYSLGDHKPGQEGSAMLVFTRGKKQQIVIDDNIVVTVVDIRGEKIRLGIEAPKEVPVHRREVHDLIRRGAPDSDSAVPRQRPVP
jgi:carbon storage regulator